MLSPFNPRIARQVTADTLEPHQQPTSLGFQTKCDFYQRRMLKHPFLSDFHSYAEYLHAGLLEGDADVVSYVPQPFQLMIRRKRYRPDCYFLHNVKGRRVRELRPRGEMREDEQVPLTHFLAQYGMHFEVISNESVFAREIEAENWLEIVRILHQARQFTTTNAEQQVLEKINAISPCTLGDVIDDGDRERTYLREIALFRLLHRGYLSADLTASLLDFDLEISC